MSNYNSFKISSFRQQSSLTTNLQATLNDSPSNGSRLKLVKILTTMILANPSLLFALANILIPLGCAIFMSGFFRGVERNEPFVPEVQQQELEAAWRPKPPFNKVIFMLVDALRSDFVYANNTGFTFTQSLIRGGSAIPFTARASPPTLTLSRIKAITQGSSQSFLDSLLNVLPDEGARQLRDEDTWLARMKSEIDDDRKMVYHGCDMWTMLYPDIWDRYSVVESTYLADFTSGDIEIAKNLHAELEREDWKALVLHLVGLDDVAHFGGPRGSHMVPKQAEMDHLVKRIYGALSQRPSLSDTLFVLIGDHGMTEKGNHGGDSPGEMSAALTFVSPKFQNVSRGRISPLPETKNYEYYNLVDQIDVVPTLAGLLGFAIPANSAGLFIPELLSSFNNPQDAALMQMVNGKQIARAFKAKYPSAEINFRSCAEDCQTCPDEPSRIFCSWMAFAREQQLKRNLSENSYSEEFMTFVTDFMKNAQRLLSKPLNNLSFPRLFVGVTCMCLSILLLRITYSSVKAPLDLGSLTFETVTLLHASTMLVSSLVREEHHYWYLASMFWLGCLGYQKVKKSGNLLHIVYPIALQFVSQCFNPHEDVPLSTVAFVHDALFDYPILLWGLGSITYVNAAHKMCKYLGFSSTASMAVTMAFCSIGLVFKLCVTTTFNPELFNFAPPWLEKLVTTADGNFMHRILWTGLAICATYLVLKHRVFHRVSKETTLMGIVELCNLYLRSQTRPKNLMLHYIFDLQLRWLLAAETPLTPSEIAVTTLLLGQSSFFAGGRDNSIASLDLMNGYNGVYDTENNLNYAIVALQTLISNWLGPIWWSLASMRLLLVWHQSSNPSKVATGSRVAESDVKEPVFGQTKAIDQTKPNVRSRVDEHGLSNGSTKGISFAVPEDNDYKRQKLVRMQKADAQKRHALFEHLVLQTLFAAASSLAVMLSCIWLREDPDLWIVLAPKFINSGLWVAFYHVVVNLMSCSIIWRVVVTA